MDGLTDVSARQILRAHERRPAPGCTECGPAGCRRLLRVVEWMADRRSQLLQIGVRDHWLFRWASEPRIGPRARPWRIARCVSPR